MRRPLSSLLPLLLLLLLAAVLPASSFKPEEFKKCADSGFCRRNRARASGKHTYSVLGAPRLDASGALVADVINEATLAQLMLEVGREGREERRGGQFLMVLETPAPAQRRDCALGMECGGGGSSSSLLFPLPPFLE